MGKLTVLLLAITLSIECSKCARFEGQNFEIQSIRCLFCRLFKDMKKNCTEDSSFGVAESPPDDFSRISNHSINWKSLKELHAFRGYCKSHCCNYKPTTILPTSITPFTTHRSTKVTTKKPSPKPSGKFPWKIIVLGISAEIIIFMIILIIRLIMVGCRRGGYQEIVE